MSGQSENLAADSAERPSAYFRTRRLGHANVWVSNYESLYEFYNRVLGFNKAYIQPDNKASFVSNGNSHHDVGMVDVKSPYAPRADQKPGLNHLGFELRNEVELVEGYRRAIAAGIKFVDAADHDVAHSLYLKDPDGNEIELYADVVPDWRAVRNGTVIKKKPKYVPGVSSEPLAEAFFVRNPTYLTVEGAVFRPLRTTHASLIARDFEAMYDFYTDFVGLKPFAGNRSADFAVLAGTHSDGDVVLHRAHRGSAPCLHHVGVLVRNERDLDEAGSALAKLGVTVDSQVQHPARRALTILDPDMLRVQMYVNRDWRPGAIAGLDPELALKLL
jgi:catechol 2,3-dioxygenase